MQMKIANAMNKFVPYLPEAAIERDAAALLSEYARARGVAIVPPIPIEDIVEKYLKLGIEFDDTHRLFGIPRDPECDGDILGAIFFDEARIVIDESLDPVERRGTGGAIGSRSPMKAVVTGVCIDGSSPLIRLKWGCLPRRRLRRSSAGLVRPSDPKNGRPTFTPHAC